MKCLYGRVWHKRGMGANRELQISYEKTVCIPLAFNAYRLCALRVFGF